MNEEKKAASFIPYITNLQQPVDVKVRARKGKDTTLHRKEGQQQWTKNVEEHLLSLERLVTGLVIIYVWIEPICPA